MMPEEIEGPPTEAEKRAAGRAFNRLFMPQAILQPVLFRCGNCLRTQQWMLPDGLSSSALSRVRCFHCKSERLLLTRGTATP